MSSTTGAGGPHRGRRPDPPQEITMKRTSVIATAALGTTLTLGAVGVGTAVSAVAGAAVPPTWPR